MIRKLVFLKLWPLWTLILLVGLYIPVRAVWDWTVISNEIDLTLQQTGQVISGNVNTVSSTGLILNGDLLRYQVTYQNEGTTGANNLVISGSIAPGTCYVVGTLEANPLTGYTIAYDNATGAVWNYAPVGATGAQDCNVTFFKLEKTTLSGTAQLIDHSNITGGVLSNIAYVTSGAIIDPFSIYSHVAPNPVKPLLTGAGVSGGGGVSSREFFQSGHYYRLRQDGTVKRLRLYVAHTTNLTGFYVKIWRQNTGGNFDLVGQTENILPNIISGSISDIVLDSPITGAQEGDYYGFHMLWTTNGGQLNIPVEAGIGGQNMYFITNTGGAGDDFPWATSGTFTTSTYPIEIYMDQTDAVFIGASLVAGHPPHYSFIETLPRTLLTGTIQHFFSDLTNYTFQNMGMGGQRIADVVGRFERDVLNMNPKMVVISIGFNDIALSTSKENYMSGRRYILNATENAANIQKVVILKLTPWTEGGTGRNITKDDRNDSVTELASEYSKAVVVDAAPYIGTAYTGAGAVSGNLWYLQEQYDYGDGVHLTISGNQMVAQAIYDTLTSGNVTLSNDLFGDFRMLFTGSASFTKWKKLFTDILLPTNTSVTYSARLASDLDCSQYTGNGILHRVSSSSSQVSLAAISGAANSNICITAHMKTTNRTATPFLTGLIATYAEAPLTFNYNVMVSNQSASMANTISMYSTSGTLVSANYGWSIFPVPAPTLGGGGGGSSVRVDYCPQGDYSPSGTDGTCGVKQQTTPGSTGGQTSTDTPNNEQPVSSKDIEMTAAYLRAYENGITTLAPESKARVYDPITREELAKMMSQYASKMVGKTVMNSEDTCNDFGDINEASWDLIDDITFACQLGIMGMSSSGVPLTQFNPQGVVTRAEFATVFSRVLWGSLYEKSGEDRYMSHLNALYDEGILTKRDTPFAQELRGRILLMLWRAQ